VAATTTYGARVYFEASQFADLRDAVFKSLLWSPDGRFLAAESVPSDAAPGSVWWIYRHDGSSLALSSIVPSSLGATWVSGGEIVFAPVEGGLRLMNLDQANAQAILLDQPVLYRLPGLDANGALVFFGRDPNDSSVPQGYGRLLRLARGAQQLETIGQVPVALDGLRWAPGGTLLVAFQGGVIVLYDPSTGVGFPLPMTDGVAYAWGVPGAAAPAQDAPTPASAATAAPTGIPTAAATTPPTPLPVSTVSALTLSSDSFFLAPDYRGIVQVWRMPASGQAPQPFTGSGSDVNEFAVAPDGTTVGYVVDAELWLQAANTQPALLARINSFAPVEADFSGDSAKIAYVDERSGIWLDVIAENAPQLVHANTDGTNYHRPQFSPDGASLLLDVYGSAGVTNGVLNLTTRDLITGVIADANDPRPTQSRWLRDGRIYSYVDAVTNSSIAPGLYVFDPIAPGATPAQWIPLDAGVTVRASIEAVSGTLRVLQAQGTETFAPLTVVDYDLMRGDSRRVLDIGPMVAPQFSPDGRFVGGFESLTLIDGVQQGAILIVDLQTGRRFLLNSPAAAWEFRWAAP
jgi:WD40 repeat protein